MKKYPLATPDPRTQAPLPASARGSTRVSARASARVSARASAQGSARDNARVGARDSARAGARAGAYAVPPRPAVRPTRRLWAGLWAGLCVGVMWLQVACNGSALCVGTACTAPGGCPGAACPPSPPWNPPAPSGDVCEAQRALAQKLGTSRMLVGIMSSLDRERYERHIEGVPYGLKYLYLANRANPGGPCTDCNNCPRNNVNWWGCWSGGQPGGHLRQLFSSSQAAGQIPMVVYYTFYQTVGEWTAQIVAGVRNINNVRDYLDDWRFVLRTTAEYQRQQGRPVMLHMEPDLWGYLQLIEQSQGPVHVDVQGASRGDCSGAASNFSGLGQCMVHMARLHAPDALVGMMASGWATGVDINFDSNPGLDVEDIARRTGEYLNSFGAHLADFLVVEFSDRDAGYYAAREGQQTRWYDASNQHFPNFHRTFLWAKTLSDVVRLPLVWWQIPMGHAGLNNTEQRWQDNRVDYLFAHLDELAATQAVALAFGPGRADQTNPATDLGNLARHVRTYANGPGQPWVCAQE